MICVRPVIVVAVAWQAVIGPLRAAEPAEVAQDRKVFRLPGLIADVDRGFIDLDATVCLREGMLELIACTRDTKEHESIVTVDARPMHIHAALLLLGVRNGNPAMTRRIEGQPPRWVVVPPRGDPVQVSLVVGKPDDPRELPISAFVRHIASGGQGGVQAGDDAAGPTRFPDTFVFAGSQVQTDEQGARRYLADDSGHVISIATFGDEVLCLPGLQSHENASLVWEVDSERLPEVGTRVTLRLRPQNVEQADNQP